MPKISIHTNRSSGSRHPLFLYESQDKTFLEMLQDKSLLPRYSLHAAMGVAAHQGWASLSDSRLVLSIERSTYEVINFVASLVEELLTSFPVLPLF